MQDEVKISTEYNNGNFRDGLWSGVFMSPPETHNSERFGRIFGIVNLSAPKEFDSKVAGDLLVENIQDVYYEDNKDGNIVSRLEKAILSTAKRLEYLLQREEIAAEEGIDLNIVAFVVFEKYVYMALLGEGGIMLYRDGNLINLTEGLKDLTGRNLIRSGSGKFNFNDKFILLSSVAMVSINEQELKKAAELISLDEIKSESDNPLFGLMIVGILNQDRDFNGSIIRKSLDSDIQAVSEEEEGALEDEKRIDGVEDQEKEEGSDSGERREESKAEEKPSFKDKLTNIKEKVKDKVSDKKTYQVMYQKTVDFLVKAFGHFKVHVWEGFLGFGKGRMYLRGAGPRRSIRGIIILIMLAVSILYLSINGINKHKEKVDNREVVEQILIEVEDKLNDGRNLGEAGSISESVTLLEEALNQLDGAKQYNLYMDEITQKEIEVLALLDEIRKVVILNDDDLITDIGGYIENANATDMILLNSILYICDTDAPALYSIDEGGGEVSIVFGDESLLSSPHSLTSDSDGNILINDLENGLMKYNVVENNLQILAGLSSTTLGDVATIENYTTPEGVDILYLLRPNNNDIRKVLKYPSGYASPELRLAETKLSGVKDMEIDGKIYILTGDDDVIRYFYDQEDPFTLVGLDKTLSDATSFELDDKLIFVGDTGNKRIVVFIKGAYLTPNQGEYVAQIIYRGVNDYLSDIREISVDNDSRVMYILDGTKVFRVQLSKIDEYAEAFE